MRLDFSWLFRCSASILAGVLAVMVGCSAPPDKNAGSSGAGRCHVAAEKSTDRQSLRGSASRRPAPKMPIPTPPVPPRPTARQLHPATPICPPMIRQDRTGQDGCP